VFRQDRTNPSTAVSTWKGRKDLPKANPSTAVSAWLNGGLAGGATIPIAYGGTTDQDDLVELEIAADSGWVLICPGLLLQNGLIVKAFAAAGDVININGFVNRIDK